MEILQFGAWDAQHAGLERGTASDLLRKLVQAGRQLAEGGTGCTPLQSAIAIVQREVTSGRITSDQADLVLGELFFIQSLMGC